MKGSEAAYVLRTSGARILCTMGEFLGFNYVDSLGDQELPKLEKVVVLKDSAPDAVTWSEFLTSGNAISEALALERIESVGPRIQCAQGRGLRKSRCPKSGTPTKSPRPARNP